jgi:hypothetical protein
MANNRVYYAIQQVLFRKNSSGSLATDPHAIGSGAYTPAHGVQSVGLSTTFNLEQVFELGQLAIYENVEGTPDIEVTMSKVLDGYPPLWILSTSDQIDGPQLNKRCTSNNKTIVQLGIFDEALQSAGETGGTPGTWVEMSGLYPTSISYNFPVDDNFSEDITLVGNTKIWGTGLTTSNIDCQPKYYPSGVSGLFSSNEDRPIGSGGVARRQNILFATGYQGMSTGEFLGPAAGGFYTQNNAANPDRSILPGDIPGVISLNNTGVKGPECHIQSMSVSVDVAREELFELGSKIAYARPLTFPIEVTCDIEVTTASGDLVSAIDECGTGNPSKCAEGSNLANRGIRIATCEGTRIWLGKKNKLASVTYGGGDAGGGNATVTYSYSTFNDFTVIHSGDTLYNGGSAAGGGWWNDRNSYLNFSGGIAIR